jgi:hypothetical protein
MAEGRNAATNLTLNSPRLLKWGLKSEMISLAISEISMTSIGTGYEIEGMTPLMMQVLDGGFGGGGPGMGGGKDGSIRRY